MKHNFRQTKDFIVSNVLYGIPAAVTTGIWAATQTFCGDGDAGWLTGGEQVTIDPAGVDPNNLVNNIVTLVCAIISLGGIVTIAQGYGTYSSGHAEDNSATESKGVRKMIAGVVAAAAPWVIQWLLGTS